MKPFHTLTTRGRNGRLRQMAQVALQEYDLDVARMSLLSTSFNTIFRLDTTDGQQYVLRLNYPGERQRIDIYSEMVWLAALRRDTHLAVPLPLPTRQGDLMTTVTTPGVPQPRHCAIFGWLNGRTVGRRKSPTTFHKMGAAMAQLHNHAATFQPPTPFSQRDYSTVWHFDTPHLIYDDAPHPLFTPERRHILRATAQRVGYYLEQLYQDDNGRYFLHADMHTANVRLHQGHLQILDFDDTVWCYPVQDIGIALFYSRTHPRYTDLLAAFKAGYQQQRPWPEAFPDEITYTIAQRTLDLISFMIHERDNPEFAGALERYVTTHVPHLQSWLQTTPP